MPRRPKAAAQVMSTIEKNIAKVAARIREAAQAVERDPASVGLLAVSKTQLAAAIREAAEAGMRDFGENYLQEALQKKQELQDLDINWHFIGAIQSNKTRLIAQNFNWVHTIDRLKIAQRLSEPRAPEQTPLNICIQVNTSGENSKSGVSIEATFELAKQISRLPQLHLRGLMTIPAAINDFEQQRQPFRLLRELKDEIQSQGIELDTLSMGMSNDMEAAIAEGSTIVRIGTAIFGARN